MFKLKFIFIFLCCVLSLSAAKKEKVPNWVLSPSSVYSENEYIAEIGTGSSQKEADTKAIEGLASIFNRSVTSKTDSLLKYQESASGADKTKTLDQSVSVLTNIKDLIGVEIKERWKSKSGTFYALAVLNRNKAIVIYSKKAESCASSIVKILDVSNSERGTFAEYVRYVTAYAKSLEVSMYSAYLAVLNPAGTVLYETDYSPDSLRIQASNVAKNILIAMNLEGCDSRIKAIFEKIFTSKGFTIVKNDKARYVLNVVLKKGEETGLSDGRIMVRYSLTSELVDSKTADILIPFVINDKAVQFSSEGVNSQIFKSIKKKLERDFEALFNQLINGVSLE